MDCKSIRLLTGQPKIFKNSSRGVSGVPQLDGGKYSSVKEIWLLNQKYWTVSFCTDTVGQFCTVTKLQTVFLDIFAAGEVYVNILDYFMSRTVLVDIGFCFVL